MYRWIKSISLKLRRASHDRRGVAALVFAVAATVLIGAAGFAVDAGVVLSARQALQANTNAAVLDAAYVWDQPGGAQSAAVSAAQTWSNAHPVPMVSGIAASATAVCVSNTSLPACGGTNNAVSLTQTGTVPTYFIKVLGINSWTVSAKATAAKLGGPTKAMNVMFVLDSTGSMGSDTDDTGCNVPGISSPKKIDCAKYGVQLVLKQLNPQIDQVGLMVFPGMSSSWIPCVGSPNIVPYGTTGITYQVNGSTLSTDYATSVGSLNHSSKLIMAVGDNSSSFTGCLTAPGGEKTFYADAIAAAQATLQAKGSATAQNVIILLSDGEANAPKASGTPLKGGMDPTYATTACSSNTICSPGHLEQQCNQAVANGESATKNGTWVFAIAYDSDVTAGDKSGAQGCLTQSVTSGSGKSQATVNYYDSPTGADSNVWAPCTTLRTIASDPTKFFSTNSSCSSVNSYSDVASQFQQVVSTLSSTLSMPRLVLN